MDQRGVPGQLEVLEGGGCEGFLMDKVKYVQLLSE